MNLVTTFLKFVIIIWLLLSSKAISNTINKIEIIGNDRISDETIKLFISINKDDEINDVKLNNIINDLYDTNFFKNISVNFKNQILVINVEENPIIENIYYNGIKSQRILELIKQNSLIKSRSSFNEILLKNEKIIFENYTFTVEASDKRRIKKIKIKID